jgi:hypothetical protein
VTDNPKGLPSATDGDELRAEFRIAQRQRMLDRGVGLWRDTARPERGPQPLDPSAEPDQDDPKRGLKQKR